MVSESIAVRLKTLREARGITKYRLAKISGVSETYIYRIEKGLIKNPRRDTLQKLAQGLSITLAQLVGETGPLDTWQLVEQSLKAYIPVYTGIYEDGMEPVDHVVCTRSKVAPETVRGYRIAGLSLEPEIRDGDTIIVDTDIPPTTDDLVVVVGKAIEGKQRLVAIKRYSKNGHNEQWVEDNEGRCDLDNHGCCGQHGMCVYGVITEYVRRLR